MATVTAAELSLEKTLEELVTEYNNLRSDVSAVTFAGLLTAANSILVFEGATEDAYETSLTVVDPTADRTITLPNVTGTVVTTGNADAGATTTTFGDLDHFLINDGGTLKKMALSTVLSSLPAGSLPALTPASANVNALGSAALEWSDLFLGDGSIISFGNDQDVTLTHVADTGLTLNLMMAATTFEPSADTAAGDNAAIGYTAAEGLILTGQGSTSDITLKNDADGTVFTVPTGTDDILFPDSAKAMFGAGSDLQIFHDGSNSYIQDTGTGNLFIEGSLVQIRNSGGTEAMASFTPDGAVSLHYNSAVKLATASTGVTMTGEVTATGFTGTLDGILGSGAAAAATVTTLTASGIASIDDTTDTTSGTTGSIHTDGGLGVAKALHVGTTAAIGATPSYPAEVLTLIGPDGENVIGMAADTILALSNAADCIVALHAAASSKSAIYFGQTGSSGNTYGRIEMDNAADDMSFWTNNAERVTISSAGAVTISQSLIVSGNLTVTGTTTQVNTVTMNAANAVVFEGATADNFETTLTIIDPTADRTITLPDQSGTVHTSGGSIVIPNAANIGSAGDADAIAIASNGVVTFSQIPVLPANSILIANLVDNSITEAKMANDAIGSAELKTLSTLLIKNAAGSTLKTLHGAGA